MTTALPVIGRDLRAGMPTLQWTVNTYGLAYAAGIITAAAPMLPLHLFRPALISSAGLSLLGALTALALRRRTTPDEVVVAPATTHLPDLARATNG